MCWSYHPALRLIRLAAGRIMTIPHGIWHMPVRLGYVVGVAWHLPVTGDAPTLRLPSAERRVSCGDQISPRDNHSKGFRPSGFRSTQNIRAARAAFLPSLLTWLGELPKRLQVAQRNLLSARKLRRCITQHRFQIGAGNEYPRKRAARQRIIVDGMSVPARAATISTVMRANGIAAPFRNRSRPRPADDRTRRRHYRRDRIGLASRAKATQSRNRFSGRS